MGDDEAMLVRLWREKRGEVEPEDLSDNLIVQLGTVTEDLNRRWYERKPVAASRTCSGGFSTPSISGWPRLWMGSLIPAGRCSKPNSCCPGRSRRKPPPKSTWRSCSTICGCLSQIRGAVDHHRWRQMGRDDRPCRSAVPAPVTYRREEVLALRESGENPGCLASSRHGRGWRRSGSSI